MADQQHHEIETDVLIVGGTTGGVAAAMAVARAGLRCVVTEETDWIGGQLTAQAVPPDENQWVETTGATRTYQAFRNGVRCWYRANRTLTARASANERLNPGGGWVSRLCCEPAVAHAVLLNMLAGSIDSGAAMLLTEHRPVGVDVEQDSIRAVTFMDPSGDRRTVRARYVLDATDPGDVLPLCGAEHSIGSESIATYGELHGHPDRDDPTDQQACSWCFAVENVPEEPRPIERPASYDFWKSYVPQMDPPWTGPLFSWVIPTHNKAGRRTLRLIPSPDTPPAGEAELWRYRRIRNASIYARGSADVPVPRDLCLVNWVQMDYWRRPLLGVDAGARRTALDEAKEQSRCFLYWMQHDAPRHDGDDRTGYPGLRLSGDALGTSDGFAKAPYIREPRRLHALTVVTEAHVGTEQRRAEGRSDQDKTPFGSGEPFEDSVGIGQYPIDLHPSCSGRGSVYVPAAPFRIPLGAMIPMRITNLLAAGKCLGVSHVANGCFRLHPVEWNVGEAAGTLAAWCIGRSAEPHAVHSDTTLLREYQRVLIDGGVRLRWPWEAALPV